MYADDTTASFNADNAATLKFLINKDLESLDKWLITNKLSLNVSKTEFMLVTTRQKRQFIDEALSISIKNKPIKQVKSSKTLGLHIEETLSWSKHIEHICKKVSPLLGLLKRIREYVDQDTIHKALIQPHLDYGCAARIITRSRWVLGNIRKQAP